MNATAQKSLRFHRERSGTYFAKDGRFQYAVYRDSDGRWILEIRELIHLPARRIGDLKLKALSHAVGQPLVDSDESSDKRTAVAIANAYSGFENPYEAHLHRQQSRITAAVNVAFDRLIAADQARYERQAREEG
jgi:hypothetical protein